MAVHPDYQFYVTVLVLFIVSILTAKFYPLLVNYFYERENDEYTYKQPKSPEWIAEKMGKLRELGKGELDPMLLPKESVLIYKAVEYAKREQARWLQKKLESREADLETLRRMNMPHHRLQEELLRHSDKVKRAQEAATRDAEVSKHRWYMERYLKSSQHSRHRTGLVRGTMKNYMDRNQTVPTDIYLSQTMPENLLQEFRAAMHNERQAALNREETTKKK